MKEEDIRPHDLFNQYLALARKDVETYFSDQSRFEEVCCPACAADASDLAIRKLGFNYRQCGECSSLFVSPRPPIDQIEEFYLRGESVKFWATDFFARTAESRRQRIFRPRAELLREIVSTRNGPAGAGRFVDLGSGYGIFLEEVAALGLFEEVVGIEPSPALAAVSRGKGFRVIETIAERLVPGVSASYATAFEVLEHLWDPIEFLRGVENALLPGGRLIFTTLTATGFDIQVLWERSNSVHPPHHLNLISVEGMKRLIARSGFELEDLSTPGELDVDIVRNALAQDPELPISRFEKWLAGHSSEAARSAFQRFLQSQNLSSHIRVVAVRR